MKFRNEGGSHNEGGRDYAKGEVIESRRPLDKIFVGKFTRVGDEIPASPGTTNDDNLLPDVPSSLDVPPVVVADTEEAGSTPPPGVNVTEMFFEDEAESAGVCVFRDGKEYNVYRKPSNVALNPAPFTRKPDVDKFIEGLAE